MSAVTVFTVPASRPGRRIVRIPLGVRRLPAPATTPIYDAVCWLHGRDPLDRSARPTAAAALAGIVVTHHGEPL